MPGHDNFAGLAHRGKGQSRHHVPRLAGQVRPARGKRPTFAHGDHNFVLALLDRYQPFADFLLQGDAQLSVGDRRVARGLSGLRFSLGLGLHNLGHLLNIISEPLHHHVGRGLPGRFCGLLQGISRLGQLCRQALGIGRIKAHHHLAISGFDLKLPSLQRLLQGLSQFARFGLAGRIGPLAFGGTFAILLGHGALNFGLLGLGRVLCHLLGDGHLG